MLRSSVRKASALGAAVLLCLVVGTLSPSAGASRRSAAAWPFSVGACRGLVRVSCGVASVPLYWNNPHKRHITVRFRIYRRTDRALPALEPIVAMEGGPGYPSIGSAATYLMMIGPLAARHDLILMDNRGTGSSDVVNCPKLQGYVALTRPGDVAGLVAGCQHHLAASANAFGTDAVGNDLAYILRRLGIHRVDVYGDSYGDYSAQVFTLHHAAMVRALILDGAYNNGFNPFETEDASALRHAWTLLCERSGCGTGHILREIAHFASIFARHPLVASGRDQFGTVERVDLTAPAFAQLVYDATYYYNVFTDLPAALRAFASGDRVPLLRLAAEDAYDNSSGAASAYSAGDLAVVSCHDYPTAWDKASPVPSRRRQLAHAIAHLRSGVFFPFTKATFLASFDENELVYSCLDWKTPRVPDPAFPPGVRYPHTPVLIFDGQLDQATPLTDSLKVVDSWPNHTFVFVRNANHVTAEGDYQRCTSRILQHFVETLRAGNDSCAREMPPVEVRPAFPTSLEGAPLAESVGHTPASSTGRRAAWAVAQTAADTLDTFFNQTYGSGACLNGGDFAQSGDYYGYGPLELTLSGCRFLPDLPVSGLVVWNRTSRTVVARLVVRGTGGSGSFHVSWNTGISNWDTPAVVTGTFAGSKVDARLTPPWVPQS